MRSGKKKEEWKGKKKASGNALAAATDLELDAATDLELDAATGSGLKCRLSEKEQLFCRLKGFCFECKKENKEVMGMARDHPNQDKKGAQGSSKPQKDQKKKEKFIKKKATANETETHESDVDTVTGESDDSPEEPKN